MPDNNYRCALDLYDRNEFSLAAKEFEKILDATPDHADAHYKLANILREQQKLADAIAHYRRVLDIDPTHAEALNNLGSTYQLLGRNSEAEHHYRQAISCRATLAQPYLNLGRLLESQRRLSEACAVFSAALAEGLDYDLFDHLRSAAAGNAASSRAPDAYVRQTFDDFASSFDHHLVHVLDYRVPERLCEMTRAKLGDARRDILDLGCGTGLAGKAFSGITNHLVGVDLSGKMLEVARQSGYYNDLYQSDIISWLGSAPEKQFDLVVAADVFIYIGDLDDIFRYSQHVLRESGGFAFSSEQCSGIDYRLQPTGRYAQSDEYIQRLAYAHGFTTIDTHPAEIRKGTPGTIFLLGRRDSK